MTDTPLDIAVLGYHFLATFFSVTLPRSLRSLREGSSKNVGEKGRSLTVFASGSSFEAQQ